VSLYFLYQLKESSLSLPAAMKNKKQKNSAVDGMWKDIYASAFTSLF
jgi:hypothetical protein